MFALFPRENPSCLCVAYINGICRGTFANTICEWWTTLDNRHRLALPGHHFKRSAELLCAYTVKYHVIYVWHMRKTRPLKGCDFHPPWLRFGWRSPSCVKSETNCVRRDITYHVLCDGVSLRPPLSDKRIGRQYNCRVRNVYGMIYCVMNYIHVSSIAPTGAI